MNSPRIMIRRGSRDISIIEVLIVVIIATAIVGVAYMSLSDLQARRYNAERQRDITTVQRAIENYFSQNEKYPSLTELNSASWRQKNLMNVSDEHFTDPQGSGATLSSTPRAKSYNYAPMTTDNKTCDNSTVDCMQYTLIATQSDGTTFTKNNYN